MRSFGCLILILMGLLCACEGPVPRRPVKVSTGSFILESTERNKQLLAREEEEIHEMISMDPGHEYKASSSGSWYYYVTRVDADSPRPKKEDLVTLTYALLSFDNDTIYSKEEIGMVKYKVDKQELFPGLRNGVKLLKAGETAVFLFPSSLAYGYHGDDGRIGPNIPIKAIITILDLEKQKDSILN